MEILSHSPLRCRGKADYATTTYYSAPSGAGVFASGTINWIPSLMGTPALVRVTENLLAAFGAGPAGVAHPSVAARSGVTGRS